MDDIRILPAEQLHIIEAEVARDQWGPVFIAQGVRILCNSMDEARHVIDQIKLIHASKNKACPNLRARLLSVLETIDARKHLQLHGDKGTHGTDQRLHVIVPEFGKTYKTETKKPR